ncbi:hypothetical protein SLE2022_002680 [Rubroshorea leprosula]
MAGASTERSLEQTATWAVAAVCFVLVLISIVIEHIIHLIGKWLKKKHKSALYEALEKIKSELMLLGFISLLLTVGPGTISKICISEESAATWHPCNSKQEAKHNNYSKTDYKDNNHRRLLMVSDSGGSIRRSLSAGSSSSSCPPGKVPFVSSEGIHQLHIFIFVLAVFHVLSCILTMALGRLKMRRWKRWEKETKTVEYQCSHDPERFRLARDTSFGRRHLRFWTGTPILMWIVCFFRQFVRSVPKVDYLTLRHGFIMAHLAPQSHKNFDFQKYINKSLEEDFKVVVGISPPIWFFAVFFLLSNTHGAFSYLWLPLLPLIVSLLVGTKLQVIITKMGLRIQEKGEVVQGLPVVQPGDDLFWFNRPRLLLYLINFVLFQNAFQLAFLTWTLWEFGRRSCFHEHTDDLVIRISMGLVVQILCSYVTLPLYALVTQMGSSMKPTIFNERVAAAVRKWHHMAKKHIKQNKGSMTPMSSRPTTPHHMSPVHLLRHYRSEMDSLQTSPKKSNFEIDYGQIGSPSVWHRNRGEGSSSHGHNNMENGYVEHDRDANQPNLSSGQHASPQHEIEIPSEEFSFVKKTSV